jgi:hypothetical protein
LTLKEISNRLAHELDDLPDHPAVVDVFDYLAGAILSLELAGRDFLNRRGGQVANYKKMLSGYLSEIPKGRSPNPYWVCGYYVNSAMLRIAACYDRIPKMILKKKKGKAHQLMQAICTDPSSYANWKAVYEEVNKLKHEAEGLASGRHVSKDEVMRALKEIVSLLETKKSSIITAYR